MGWSFGIGTVAALFHANVVDVLSLGGRALHALLTIALLITFVLGPFLVFRAQQRASSGGLRSVAQRALAGVAALLTLLLALESFARTFPLHDSLAVNPGMNWMWPEFHWPPNALGFKDREVTEKRGPRILVIGDSYVEGAGVRRPDRFTNVLERLYRDASDPNLEVFNAGHCGMDTFDETEVLLATGDAVAPDVLVVGYVLNDADGHGARPVDPTRPAEPPSALRRFLLDEVGSYGFYRLDVVFNRPKPQAVRVILEEQHADASPGWRLVNESFDRIAAWASARNVVVVVVAFPLYQNEAAYYEPILERVVAAARARGFRAVDMLDHYDGDALTPFAVSQYDAHPGAAAHRLTAEVLYREIGRPWAGSATNGSADPAPAQRADDAPGP